MKKLFVVFLLAVTAIGLAGCKKATSYAIDWDVISDDLEFDKETPVTVVFWHTMAKTSDPSQGQQALLDLFIEEFKELYPNVTIVHEQKGGYTELRKAIDNALPAGNEPTMAYSYPDHVAGYIQSGQVLPLNNLINNKNAEIALSEEDIADFIPGYWAEGQVYDNRGSILNLPFLKSTEVMFYNKTFFDTNNLTVPTTWDEVKTVSQQIKTIDPTKTPFGYDAGDNLFITASEQKNIPYTSVDDQGNGKILFNNDDAKDMVRYFDEMYEAGLFTTKDMLGGQYTSDMFKAGNLFMSIGSTGGTGYNIPGNNEFEVGVAPIPQFDLNNKAVIQQGPNINLFRKSNVQENIAAWLFLKYITAAEQTARWSVATGYSPVRTSAYDVQVYKDYVEQANPSARTQVFIDVANVVKDQSSYMFTSVVFPNSSKVRDEVGNIFTVVFGNTKSVDDAFDDAYDEARY